MTKKRKYLEYDEPLDDSDMYEKLGKIREEFEKELEESFNEKYERYIKNLKNQDRVNGRRGELMKRVEYEDYNVLDDSLIVKESQNAIKRRNEQLDGIGKEIYDEVMKHRKMRKNDDSIDEANHMQDKRQIKREIIACLCGDDGLSPKFITILEAGGLSESDGEIIRKKLEDQIDSNYNLDLLFKQYYTEQLEDANDYPIEEMNEYTGDSQYLQLLDRHFPQSVDEACEAVIGMLDEEEILWIKKYKKSSFRRSQHFELGLFMRNHFGINQSQSRTLMCDIMERSGKMLFLNDDVSGYLLDELWEEVQRRY